MGKVILDAETRAKLNNVTERLALYDERGNLLGYIEPVTQTGMEPVRSGWWPFTDEEVETARKATGPGRTLDEILKDAGLE
jgi:hypothetical protein